jgi:hypothetical protein
MRPSTDDGLKSPTMMNAPRGTTLASFWPAATTAPARSGTTSPTRPSMGARIRCLSMSASSRAIVVRAVAISASSSTTDRLSVST